MFESMARNWWVPALRGVLAIIVGLIALFLPGATLYALVLLFGIYALIDGISLLFMAFSVGRANRWWLVFEGILGIAAAFVAFAYPLGTALALTLLIGAWAVVTGVLEIIAVFGMRNKVVPAWWLMLNGVLSIILGFVLFVFPVAGTFAWVWVFGVYALAAGVALLVFAFRVRGAGATKAQRATSAG